MGIMGLLQTILGGIGEGSIYALLGLSFVLIFGKLRICSVLHGDLAGYEYRMNKTGGNAAAFHWGVGQYIYDSMATRESSNSFSIPSAPGRRSLHDFGSVPK